MQYCQHRLLNLWNDSARGTLPIGWTLSPALMQIAPAMAAYYLLSATTNDEFIAGPSGAAYLFPSYYPEERLIPFLQQTGEAMQTMAMTTLEVLDSDALYSSGLPLISKASLDGMAFTDRQRQRVFAQALAPYGMHGILSGAGFILKKARLADSG